MTRGRIAFTSSLLAILAGIWLVAFMFPVALAIVAFAGLSAKCTNGSALGERAATACLAILVAFAVVTGFSIGILVLPVAALVGLAVATTPLP